MLRRIMPQRVEDAELGFVVQGFDREHIQYLEAGRSVLIDVDIGHSGTVIYKDSVQKWVTDNGWVEMAPEDIDIVIARAVDAVQLMGDNVIVS
jgi:hypothetical protein